MDMWAWAVGASLPIVQAGGEVAWGLTRATQTRVLIGALW